MLDRSKGLAYRTIYHMKKTKEQLASAVIGDLLYTKFRDIFPSRGDWDHKYHHYWTYNWDNTVHRVSEACDRITMMTNRLTAFGRSPDVYMDAVMDTGIDIYRPGYVLDNTPYALKIPGDTIFYAGLRTYIECTVAPDYTNKSDKEYISYAERSQDTYAVVRVQLLMPGMKPHLGESWNWDEFIHSYEVTDDIATFLRECKSRVDKLYLDVAHGAKDLREPKHQAEELVFYVTADPDSMKKVVERSEFDGRAKK